MQDESLLRAGELAKGGRQLFLRGLWEMCARFSAVDLFSGRQARALRALEALVRRPSMALES